MVEPPELTPPPGEPPGPPEGQRPRRERSGRSVALPAAVGLVLGIGAIVIAFVLLRNGDSEASPPPAPAQDTSPAVEPSLRIVFPEGFTRREMAERIGAVNDIAFDERGLETSLSPEEYLAATRRANPFRDHLPRPFANDEKVTSLEGFLFPATYEFSAETDARQLIELQLDAFWEAFSSVDLQYARNRNLTAYDVLIIASMIEKEVRVAEERRLVASVIYNRLRAGMVLGIDATLRYGLRIPASEPIIVEQLESDNPYNTRRIAGLPPTPISNPGLATLRAAARPDETDFVFYALTNDCESHFFAESEGEFLAFLDGPDSFRNGPNGCQ